MEDNLAIDQWKETDSDKSLSAWSDGGTGCVWIGSGKDPENEVEITIYSYQEWEENENPRFVKR